MPNARTLLVAGALVSALVAAGSAGAAQATHTRVTFVRTTASAAQELAVGPQGGTPRSVQALPRRIVDAAATPSGRVSVFLQSLPGPRHSYRRQIFVRRGSGRLRAFFPRPITTVGRANIAISDDGTRIAYIRNRQVFVVGTGGRGGRSVTPAGTTAGYPAFTPDGRAVIYTRIGRSGSPLMRADLAGGQPVQITPTDDGSFLDSDISPSGRIVYVHVASDGSSEVIETARLASIERVTAVFEPLQPRFVFGPALSPNGRSIVFAMGRGATAETRRYSLMTVRATGLNPRAATSGLRNRPRGINWTRIPGRG